MKLKAFTMAEAILTMVILGVIAALMIANLKPVKYRDEGFKTSAKNVYSELDSILSTIQVNCTSGMTLNTVYNDCDTKDGGAVHAFGSVAADAALIKEYVKTLNDNGCDSSLPTGYVTNSMFKMKNGICVALKSNYVWLDLNDKQGPNTAGKDIIELKVGEQGFVDVPDYILK